MEAAKKIVLVSIGFFISVALTLGFLELFTYPITEFLYSHFSYSEATDISVALLFLVPALIFSLWFSLSI